MNPTYLTNQIQLVRQGLLLQTPQTVNELMDHTLKDYQEECVEEGTFPSDPAPEVGEWEEQDLDQMEANLNDLFYQACPFHPLQFIHCLNP